MDVWWARDQVLLAAAAASLAVGGWLVGRDVPDALPPTVPVSRGTPPRPSPPVQHWPPLTITVGADPARIPVPYHCHWIAMGAGERAADSLSARHRWWSRWTSAPPRLRALGRAVGVGPSTLAPWAGLVDPWLAHRLVEEERTWVGVDAEAYPDPQVELKHLLAVDEELASSTGEPDLERVVDLLTLDREIDEGTILPADLDGALDILLTGSDEEVAVAVDRLCLAELELGAATQQALRERVGTLGDPEVAAQVVDVGFRWASNAGQRAQARAWAELVEPTLASCERWGSYGRLARVDLPGFADLPPQLGPAGAAVLAEAARWRWPDADVDLDCEQAPCLVRIGAGDQNAARWRQWELRDVLPGVGWTGAPSVLDTRDGAWFDVVVGGVTELDADTANDWIRWRTGVTEQRCLMPGDLAGLRARARTSTWRPAVSWLDDLSRAADECQALLPLSDSTVVSARWDGDRWKLGTAGAFFGCVEDAAVLGPEEPKQLALTIAVDDGSPRHGY